MVAQTEENPQSDRAQAPSEAPFFADSFPLAERLRRAGYKLTTPRLVVLDVLEGDGQHLSPAEVLKRGQAVYPALSRATVYRTLELLRELGWLRPIYLGQRGSRVARVEGGHQHLVCLDCGDVTHPEENPQTFPLDASFGDELAGVLSQRLSNQASSYQVKGYLLELYGLCADCGDDLVIADGSHAENRADFPRIGG